MPGTELGPEDKVMNKTNKSPIFKSLHFSEEREKDYERKEGWREEKLYSMSDMLWGESKTRSGRIAQVFFSPIFK